jgi:hypothetical protein
MAMRRAVRASLTAGGTDGIRHRRSGSSWDPVGSISQMEPAKSQRFFFGAKRADAVEVKTDSVSIEQGCELCFGASIQRVVEHGSDVDVARVDGLTVAVVRHVE